jgi:hypothetical protein
VPHAQLASGCPVRQPSRIIEARDDEQFKRLIPTTRGDGVVDVAVFTDFFPDLETSTNAKLEDTKAIFYALTTTADVGTRRDESVVGVSSGGELHR